MLADLLQHCQTSTSTLKSLEQKGYLIIQPREVLRAELATLIATDVDDENAVEYGEDVTITADMLRGLDEME